MSIFLLLLIIGVLVGLAILIAGAVVLFAAREEKWGAGLIIAGLIAAGVPVVMIVVLLLRNFQMR